MVKTSTITNKNNPQVMNPAVAFSSLIWRSQKSPSISGHENSPSPKKHPNRRIARYKLFIVWRPQKIELTRPTHNNQKQPNTLISWMLVWVHTASHLFNVTTKQTTQPRVPPSLPRLLAMSIAPFEPHTTLATGSPFVQSHVPTRKNLAGGFGW